jgi:high-affinity iron transporter
MLREGIEASLIVGIVASYLRQTGRSQWMRAVWVGVALAVALCLVVGIILNIATVEFPQREQELFEAAVGLVAVVVLTSMVFWMRKASKQIKGHLLESIDAAFQPGQRQGRALVAMTFFAVAREGLESVFFLLATFQQNVGIAAPIGAVLGLAAAVAVGFGIYGGGVRLNLRQFFRWTGVFILFVAAGLLAGSLRSLHEAGVWNGLQTVAFDMSGLLPSDSPLGSVLAGILGYQDTPTIGEVAVYLVFLIPALFLFFFGMPSMPARGSGQREAA